MLEELQNINEKNYSSMSIDVPIKPSQERTDSKQLSIKQDTSNSHEQQN
jgi:hypothetical protein